MSPRTNRLAPFVSLLVAACSNSASTTSLASGSSPGAGSSRVSQGSSSPPVVASPLTGEPEVFARVPGLGYTLSLSDTALYFDERVDEAARIDRIVRVPLDAPEKREEVAKGKLASWSGNGDHLLVNLDDETTWLVEGKAKKTHVIAPFTAAAWGNGAVYLTRPPGDNPEIVIDAIDLGSAPTPKRIGTIKKSGKLGPNPNSMAASSSNLFLAIDEEGGPGVRTPSHVFSLPLAGGEANDLVTVIDLHQLAVMNGELYVGSLAKAHKLDSSGKLGPLEGMYWDFLSTDGKVSHYIVSTSLPQGGIGGYLYAWTPPAEPQRIYEKLRDPAYVVMNESHVYWINGTDKAIMRIPRGAGR